MQNVAAIVLPRNFRSWKYRLTSSAYFQDFRKSVVAAELNFRFMERSLSKALILTVEINGGPDIVIAKNGSLYFRPYWDIGSSQLDF